MKRAAIALGLLGLMMGMFAIASAAPTRVSLEIWGASSGDAITIDGAAVNVRAGGAPRVFAGDPDATNAPVLHEVAIGKHDIVVKRKGCADRVFTIHVEGTTKRSIVLESVDPARCAVPFAPPRR
jgi:hypothetical protein